ncbi:MAG: C40 family peptidase, partial [Myxococcota bacterium]
LGLASSVSSEALTATAKTYLGRSYLYGVSDGSGYDCSGFVRAVYAEYGIALPRTSRDQAQVGRVVERAALAAGDLLFFAEAPFGRRITHVGLALDGARMIHASSGRGEIVIDALDGAYYADRLVTIRRVLGEIAPTSGEPATFPRTEGLGVPSRRWRVAGMPASAVPQMSALDLRTGWAAAAAGSLWYVAPRLSVVAPRMPVWLRLEAPFAVDGARYESLWRYDRPQALLRLVDAAIAGRPDGPAYLSISRRARLTLGDGELVRESTPEVVGRAPPGLPVPPAPALSLAWRAGRDRVSIVADDVVVPRVLGMRLEWGRLSRAALEVAVDPRAAQEARTGAAMAATAHLPLWLGDSMDVVSRGALAGLMVGRPALGASAGSMLALRLGAVETAVELDGHWHDAAYVPGLYGYDYRLLVGGTSTQPPLWEGLRALGREPVRWRMSQTMRWRLRVADVIDFSVALDQGPRRAGILARRRLAMHLELSDVSLGTGWMRLSGFVSYQQRFEEAIATPLRAGLAEVFFAGMRVRAGAYVGFAFEVAKRPSDGSGDLEALVEATFGFPL